ncbi:hypothetical protein ACN6UN_000197 [Cronobacter turicensis]|nr:hypothetical protein [Cronobacter turicensis]
MRKKKIIVAQGLCKLTLKKGRYVDSHILPRALTLIGANGERTIQAELNGPTRRRFQGWYDNQLVIDKGESILSDIDNKAIKLLRKNHLVWSGWPSVADRLPCPNEQLLKLDEKEDYPNQFRRIEGVNFLPLKVFFLSILWRAAASTREDMKDISLPDDMLEKLRLATLNQDPLNLEDFPVLLFQHGTRGIPHNRTPIIEKHSFHLVPPFQMLEYTVCRIYMDGLVAHVVLDADDMFIENLATFILGAEKYLFLSVQPFEASRALDNLKEVLLNN